MTKRRVGSVVANAHSAANPDPPVGVRHVHLLEVRENVGKAQLFVDGLDSLLQRLSCRRFYDAAPQEVLKVLPSVRNAWTRKHIPGNVPAGHIDIVGGKDEQRAGTDSRGTDQYKPAQLRVGVRPNIAHNLFTEACITMAVR